MSRFFGNLCTFPWALLGALLQTNPSFLSWWVIIQPVHNHGPPTDSPRSACSLGSAGLIPYAGSPNFWTEPAGICAVFTTSSGQYFSQAWPTPLIPASYHSIVSFYFILGSCFSFQEGWTGTEHFLGEASHFWAGYWLCSQPEFIRSKEMKTSHQVLHCFIVEVDDPT